MLYARPQKAKALGEKVEMLFGVSEGIESTERDRVQNMITFVGSLTKLMSEDVSLTSALRPDLPPK